MNTSLQEEPDVFVNPGSQKPRRALIVTPSSTKAMDVSGGVAKTYEVLSERLEKAGVKVDFCSSWTNLDYLSFPSYPEFRDIASSKANRKKMSEFVSKADVVICSDSAALLWLLAECIRQGKRSLWGLHTDLFNRSEVDSVPPILIKILFYFGSYLSDVTFTTSYIFKNKLNGLGFDVNFVLDQDFKCAEFKVDDDPDEISQLRKTLMCDDTEFMVLYAGRLSKEKRIDLLFHALPENATMVVVGDGPEKGKMQDYERQYKNVKLVAEMVPQDVLRKFYKAADLHMSASNSETYGMTVRESLYCGTPVVVQNSGGFIEQVRPYIDGFLVDFEDSETSRAHITKALGMLDKFNPYPQHNDVVDLPDFISNGEYQLIKPYSRARNQIMFFLLTRCLQPIWVLCYYCVSFFIKLLGIRAEM